MSFAVLSERGTVPDLQQRFVIGIADSQATVGYFQPLLDSGAERHIAVHSFHLWQYGEKVCTAAGSIRQVLRTDTESACCSQ
jgi:hypothetical protein